MIDSRKYNLLFEARPLIERLPWSKLALPLAAAEDAIARLDERLARSSLRDGFLERSHFADAVASVWIDGTRVDIEDLVLHDADMDVRAPTPDLTRAHHVLRLRRRIFANEASWAVSKLGLTALRGRAVPSTLRSADLEAGDSVDDMESSLSTAEAIEADDDPQLSSALAAVHAAMRRTDARLAPEPWAAEKNAFLYDIDWDEDARLTEWLQAVSGTDQIPAVLAAAVGLYAWDQIEPLQHLPWLGRLLASAILRVRGKTKAHLFGTNAGLRTIRVESRRSKDETQRLLAFLNAARAGAEAGLADHDRWFNARAGLSRKLVGRRSTSKLAELIDLVMRRPVVSTRMIAAEIKITQRAAQNLVTELGLREVTGRGHYRAWGVL